MISRKSVIDKTRYYSRRNDVFKIQEIDFLKSPYEVLKSETVFYDLDVHPNRLRRASKWYGDVRLNTAETCI